jgi:hypothetical protein
VTANEIDLEAVQRVRWNPDVGQLAKAGVHAVDGLATLHGRIDA